MASATGVLTSRQPASVEPLRESSPLQCCGPQCSSSTKGQSSTSRRFSLTGLLRIASSKSNSNSSSSSSSSSSIGCSSTSKQDNAKVVNNLYRRPNASRRLSSTVAAAGCVGTAAGQATSLLKMKRLQVANRMQWFNQNVDEDYPDFEDDDILDSDEDGDDDAEETASATTDTDDQPQYCRKRAQSSPSIPGSILKKCCREAVNHLEADEQAGSLNKQQSIKKQTSFKENVEIFYYDSIDNPDHNEASSDLQSKDTNAVKEDDFVCMVPFDLSSDDLTNTIFKQKQIVTLQSSEGIDLALRLVMCLKDELCEYSTSITVTSSGRSLIVTAKPPKHDTENCPQHITQKVALPFRVHPVHVKASVSWGGKITVEAPLV